MISGRAGLVSRTNARREVVDLLTQISQTPGAANPVTLWDSRFRNGVSGIAEDGRALLGFAWVMLTLMSDDNASGTGIQSVVSYNGAVSYPDVVGVSATYAAATGHQIYIWPILGTLQKIMLPDGFDSGPTVIRGKVTLWRDYPGAIGP